MKDEPSLQAFYQMHPGLFVFPTTHPDKTITFPAENLRVFLIPGRAFDRRGGRLGRSWACYDKFLKDKSCLKIGVSWSFQMEEKLPLESHDINMDIIVTDKFVLIPDIQNTCLNEFKTEDANE